MHVDIVPVDIDEVVKSGPLSVSRSSVKLFWGMIFIGLATFICGVSSEHPAHAWAAYFVNLVFFMGLSMGGTVTSAIFQVVRAKWSPPIRRFAESNSAFFPVAYLGILTLYFGKEYLFYWGSHPMPGREIWMQADFVFARFAVLFFLLFFLLTKFVNLSLKADVGLARERDPENPDWHRPIHNMLLKNWTRSEQEVLPIQRTLSRMAPVMIFLYAVIYSLFAFEVIMGMDKTWFSNLFGAFIFVSSIYTGWASIAMMCIFLSKRHPVLHQVISTQQTWDLGKLCLGFCLLWGYMFWSQFLPQWYGNLPEETQWMILRVREFPWKYLGWLAFASAFVIPFVSLISRDVKKSPKAFGFVCCLIFLGVWMDRYVIIMPQVSPERIPFGFTELGIFIGFLGAYLLCVRGFLNKHPVVPVASPLTHGSQEW